MIVAAHLDRAMANHASTRTTQLYARRPKETCAEEIDRICM
jgi:hypothetical protein